MKNNKTLIFAILLFPFLISCKKADAVMATNKSIDSLAVDSQIYITDSLFIGEPLANDPEFIRNTEKFSNLSYFNQFENVLKKHNKKYAHYKSNGFIKALKISDKLSIELKRKKYNIKDKNSDIQVILFTKINNVIKDSIVFYKYLLDKDFPKEQRFETMVFLNTKLELFKLDSYSGLSEFSFQADKWEKFKINNSNGKIEFIKKLNYRESEHQDDISEEKPATYPETDKIDGDFANKNEKFSFEDSTVKWRLICDNSNPQKNVYFDNHEASFIFSYSEGFRISLIVKKASNKIYELYYSYPPFFPAPKDMDYENYSTTKPCAEIKIVNDSKMELTWLGFHNNKTNKIERTKNPFTQKLENAPIILEKCNQ